MVAVIETPRSMSLEDALNEFIRIQNRYSELAEEKKRVLEVLIPAAIEARGETKTARLANHNGSIVIKAEFKSNATCDVNGLNVVRELIGDDKFERLFKTEYKPMLRELKPFLSTKTTDETIETAKELIGQAIKNSPASPQFTIEKGSL